MAMVDSDFVAHGLLSHPSKRKVDGMRDDIALGIGMDLVAMRFYIPPEKCIDIVGICRMIADKARKRIAIHVRTVTSGTGKIMALHIVIGNVARGG